MAPLVSIILPARNERENVLALIDEIGRVLNGTAYEIIVADDNSADGTAQAVAGRGFASVRVLCRCERWGLANAIADGLREAKGDILVVMDSDFNHQPAYLPSMIGALAAYDCVSGSRFIAGGGMAGRLHFLSTRIFNLIVRKIIRSKVTDHSYGFYALRRETLEQLDVQKIFWGHGDYCIRLMYHLQKQGARILEIPVVNGERKHGRPNRAYFKNLYRYVHELIKLIRTEGRACA